MPSDQTTRIPAVPVRTAMFQGRDDALTQTWIIFFERLAGLHGLATGEDAELKATFGLCRTLTVEDDLTNHFICRTGGTFTNLAVKPKIAPTGCAARIEIEISKDEGVTWHTIFADPGYIELADDDDTLQEFEGVWADDYDSIEVDDLLRINCTRIGSSIAGKDIEFVLRWE